MSDTLVPEPQASIFDSVTKALGNDEDAARRVMLNPNLAKGFKDGKPVNKESKKRRAGHLRLRQSCRHVRMLPTAG